MATDFCDGSRRLGVHARAKHRKQLRLLFAVLALPMAGASRSEATTRTYEGANNGNWNAAGNWSPSGLPVSGDDVYLGTYKPSGVTSDLDVTLNSTVPTTGMLNSLTLNSSALPGYTVLNQTGGTMSAINESIGTTTSENSYNQSGGTNNVVNLLNIGISSINDYYFLSGPATTQLNVSGGTISVGGNGSGTLTIAGGTATADILYLGDPVSSFGTLNLSGNGMLTTSLQMYVGYFGGGLFNQAGGTVSSGEMIISSQNSTAAYNMTGGTLTNGGELVIGTNGIFNYQSGNISNKDIQLGSGGSFNLSGGANLTANAVEVASGGIFQMNGNTATVSIIVSSTGTIQNGASTPAVLTLNNFNAPTNIATTFTGLNGTIQDGGSGTLGVTVAYGQYQFGGTCTYSGPTVIQAAGDMQATANGAFSSNSSVTLTAGGVLDTEDYAESIASLAGTGGAVSISVGGGSLSIVGNNLSTTYSGSFTGGGTLIIENGTGNLSLTGGGTFTGNINVSGGTVTVGAVNGIPTGSTVNVGANSKLNVTANQTIAQLSATDSSAIVFTNNASLTVSTGGSASVVGGDFSGTGYFVSDGSAGVTLGFGASDSVANADSNLQIYSDAGTLALNKASGTVSIAGPLTLDGGNVIMESNYQFGPASVISMIQGTLNIAGYSESIGGLSGTGGTLAMGGGSLTINQSGSSSLASAMSGSGSIICVGSGALTFLNPAGFTGSFTVSAGQLILTSTVNAASLTADGGATLKLINASLPGTVQFESITGGTVQFSNVTIGKANLNGAGTYADTSGILKIGTLTIAPGTTLDLQKNYADISTNTLSSISSLVASAFADGTWQGTGITSSSAASDTKHLTALGVIQNNQNGAAIYTSSNQFEGTTPGASDVLLKYTYYGDTNLDGKVDSTDYSRIDAAFVTQSGLTPSTGWFNGDFNYDGVVNGSDYTLIDNAFNRQGTQLLTEVATPTEQLSSAAEASVPEPATTGLLLVSTIGLLKRRLNTQEVR